MAEILLQENLFSAKENYLLSCTDTGKLREVMVLSAKKRQKRQINNMHLMDGMDLTYPNRFPELKAYNGPTDFVYLPYSEHLKMEGTGYAIHFFEDDYKFLNAIDKRVEQTVFALRNAEVIIAPDCSLYVDEDRYHFLNLQSVYRSRFFGAYAQKCGFNVIPTATWGGLDSFEYCLEGLPTNSVIAVCGIGINWDKRATLLWEYALRELERRLSPTKILICGNERPVPGLSTPVQFIPPYLSTKLKARKEAV